MRLVGQYPQTRLRRTRGHAWLRELIAEVHLKPADLVLPLFIRAETEDREIPAMPGVHRHTVEEAVSMARRAAEAGIPAISLFPTTPSERRSPTAEEAFNPNNLVCQTVRAIKAAGIPIGVTVDVALDPYTDHCHDGFIRDGDVHNDSTVEALVQQALVLADAGVDIVAPSDMMDGRIGAIREALDASGHQKVCIMSYSVKYVSALYGPFRTAVGVNKFNDKKTYQLDYRNRGEAIREGSQDVAEGADIIMVKPGMFYLDIVRDYVNAFSVPVFVYQVSGEYAMIKAAAANGWIDGDKAMLESLVAFKRAGARGIFTYAALEVAELLATSGD